MIVKLWKNLFISLAKPSLKLGQFCCCCCRCSADHVGIYFLPLPISDDFTEKWFETGKFFHAYFTLQLKKKMANIYYLYWLEKKSDEKCTTNLSIKFDMDWLCLFCMIAFKEMRTFWLICIIWNVPRFVMLLNKYCKS